MEENNKDNKFGLFKSLGVSATGLAVGIGIAGVMAMSLNSMSNEKAAYIEKQTEICEFQVTKTLEKINAPSIVNPNYLNTLEGLKMSAKEKFHKADLNSLNPEAVNCKVEEMRTKFLKGVKDIEQKQTKKVSFGSTPG